MTASRSGGRRARGRGERDVKSWSDRYSAAFGAVMALVLLAPLSGTVLANLPERVSAPRAGAGVALVALAYAGYLALARSFGPVAVSAADAAWLVLSPLPRRSVLRKTVVVLAAVSLLAGLAVALGLLSAVGVRDQFAPRLLVAAVLGVSAGVGGMAAAVRAQASQIWDAWLVAAIVVLAVFAVLAALQVGGRASPLAAAAGGSADAWAASAVAAATAAAVLVRCAWTALGHVPAHRILAASTRTGTVVAAAVVLDPGALSWIAEDAHWRRRILRSRPLPRWLRGSPALAWAEWRGLVRRPGRAALLAASTALPALAARAGDGLTPVVSVAVAAGTLAAAAACTSGARRDVQDPSLMRLSAAGGRSLLAARSLLPALVGGGWLALALTGLSATGVLGAGPWWLFGPACAPAVAAGALRMARRRPIDHSMPVVATPFGALPTGPVIWALTGADLASLGCAPFLLALNGPGTVLLPAQALFGTATTALYLLTAHPRDGR
ncbi:small basic protein [Actinomadura luteofluorescens]|uniref:Small basic protein n=1 Tax=Actinomadura luteofluorescens TaxID=46163 RepID=A0A7Y9EL03_9ACTN|nr:DUF6297 family protein [Actinomadura luteofluorescens]NYD49617.1 small basic protein [Actinomadura luteofluorescens]